MRQQAEVEHAMPAPDSPDHVFSVSKWNCSWTKPMEIAGTPTKNGSSTGVTEVTGNTLKGHGGHVSTLASGDKFYTRWQGSGTIKEGAIQILDGTWSFTGGTGKLAGIKGKGNYKGKVSPDGMVTYDVEGEYQLSPK